MNGTVLHIADGLGVILNEQGERYSFDQSDLKGGSVRNGTKVNFVPEANRATDIYPLSGENPFDSLSQGAAKLSDAATSLTGGSEVKTAAYIAASGAFISLLGAFSALWAFLGFGLELYGVYRLAVYKRDMSFFWYKVKAVVAGLIAVALIMSAISSLFFFGFSMGALMTLGIGGMVMLALGFLAAVYAIIAMFNALRGIASAYNAPLFNTAAWLYLASLLTMIFGIGSFVMLAYSIVLIIAYIKIQDQPQG